MRPARLDGRVFRGTWAVSAGLLTPDQLRSTAWRRLRRDVYADARIAPSHQLLARGVSLVAPRSSAFGGRTAAVFWGAADLASEADDVEVVVPPGVRWTPGPGVWVRSAPLAGEVVGDGRGLRWTSRVRTAVDLVRRGALDDGVVLLDRLVHAGVADLELVRAAVHELPRCRGSRLARDVVRLADGRAESPQETRLRLVLLRSGLPPPVAQFVVSGPHGFVGRADFAWPGHRLALEYDGVWHAEPGQFARDRQRMNRFVAADWRLLFATAADVRSPAGLVGRIRGALGLA